MNEREEIFDTYVIPPNFIDTGTILGGMFRLRNAIEAVALLSCIGLPVFQLPLSLTGKIIVLCLTALPLTLLALIGVAGESLSSFILNFFRYLAKRRIIYRSDQTEEIERLQNRRPVRDLFDKLCKTCKHKTPNLPKKGKEARKKKQQTKHAGKKKPPVKRRAPVAALPLDRPLCYQKEVSQKGVTASQKNRPNARSQLRAPAKPTKKKIGTAGKLHTGEKG